LILSKARQEYKGDDGVISAVYHALLRWLITQETDLKDHLIKNFGSCSIVDGVLTGYRDLFSLRAPGNSCLSALKSGNFGTTDNPINNSKGCGGVMRMAPVGLMYEDIEKAFQIGCQCAALTHGHPTGYLASGAFASIISGITSGESLEKGIDDSILILKNTNDSKETLKDIIKKMGEGWIAEEALGISIYCALVASDDFKKAVLLAVNHSGDSDSTGSITGNILGAMHGTECIPENWLQNLELRELIEETARDLFEQIK